MASTNIVYMILLIVVLVIGVPLTVIVLNDIRIYRDLQRRLREEKRRREEKEAGKCARA